MSSAPVERVGQGEVAWVDVSELMAALYLAVEILGHYSPCVE